MCTCCIVADEKTGRKGIDPSLVELIMPAEWKYKDSVSYDNDPEWVFLGKTDAEEVLKKLAYYEVDIQEDLCNIEAWYNTEHCAPARRNPKLLRVYPTRSFDLIADPGHSWLKVPISKIHDCSLSRVMAKNHAFIRNDAVYLEEDFLLPAFAVHLFLQEGCLLKFRERVCRQRYSRIRNYRMLDISPAGCIFAH